MKFVVTGAAGFIGSAICAAALGDGATVIGVDSLTDYYDPSVKASNLERIRNLGGDFTFIEGDTRQIVTEEMLAGVDAVFHQAGQPGVRGSWSTGFQTYVDLNIIATQDLLEKLRRAPGARLVMASSSSVYGNAETYPVLETSETRPFSPYGVTKLAAERLAVAYALNYGIEVVALRYFTVYGPGQRPDMAMHRLARAAVTGDVFPLYGTGSQIRDFTYVDDVVQANLLASRAPYTLPLVLNICGGSSISLSGVIGIVETVSGRKINLDRRGGQAGDVARTGGIADLAKGTLGWSPLTQLDDGLAAEVRWMEQLLSKAN